MTREEFITAGEIAFERLMSPTLGLSAAQMEQPMSEGRLSFKELAAHLTYWDGVVIRALEAVMQGEGFDWTPYSDHDSQNAAIAERTRAIPLKRVLSELRITHSAIIEAVRRIPEEKLCANGEVPDWLLSLTVLHYEQHRPEVEEAKKTLKG